MNLAPVGLTLVVTTAWYTIFLGALRAPALRLYPREILKICLTWSLVAITAPPLIFHWYLILAFICLVAWMQVWRENFLAGKVWLSVAAGLAVSLGPVFYLQAAPELFPPGLAPRAALLLLGLIHLGGAVTGLAYAGCALTRDADEPAAPPGGVWLFPVLAGCWIALFGLEWKVLPSLVMPPDRRMTPPGSHAPTAPLAIIAAMSVLTIYETRSLARRRARVSSKSHRE